MIIFNIKNLCIWTCSKIYNGFIIQYLYMHWRGRWMHLCMDESYKCENKRGFVFCIASNTLSIYMYFDNAHVTLFSFNIWYVQKKMHKVSLLNIGLFTLHSNRTPIYWRSNIDTVKRHTKIAGKITLKPEQFNLNENTGQ